MTEIQPPAYEANGCYTAEDDRRVNGSLICSEGVTGQGSDLLVQDSSLGGMRVQVLSGSAWILRDGGTLGDYYYVVNDATVHLTLTAADPTDGRIDVIVARVYDSQYAGVLNEWHLEVVTGVASPAPIAPTVPTNAIPLAQVAVPAGGIEVLAGWITDKRDYAKLCNEAVPSITVSTQVFTASGTWNKPANLKYARVRVVGGGGQGGGVPATGAGETGVSGGGGGGGYSEKLILAPALGSTVAVTVGAGGSGAAAGAAGAAGGASSFGAFAVGNGGNGGNPAIPTAANGIVSGGTGGTGTAGDVNLTGARGGYGQVAGGFRICTGTGGPSGAHYGAGGLCGNLAVGVAGVRGGGGGGSSSPASTAAVVGGAGGDGIVIVDSYIQA